VEIFELWQVGRVELSDDEQDSSENIRFELRQIGDGANSSYLQSVAGSVWLMSGELDKKICIDCKSLSPVTMAAFFAINRDSIDVDQILKGKFHDSDLECMSITFKKMVKLRLFFRDFRNLNNPQCEPEVAADVTFIV